MHVCVYKCKYAKIYVQKKSVFYYMNEEKICRLLNVKVVNILE